MTRFVDDDRGYLAWVAAHPDGYVVNCGRTPTPSYLILHRASCKMISTSTRSNWTSGDYIKFCSEDLDELRRWASGEVGGDLRPCQICSTDRGSSSGPKRRGRRP